MWEYDAGMAGELVRYQECGHLHLVTFSCYRRLPHLSNAASMELFERSLETPRVRYDFLLLCAQDSIQRLAASVPHLCEIWGTHFRG